MSADKVTLVLGAEPRVNLLPDEVKTERHAAVVRRRLGLGVVAVVLAVAAGTAGATFAAQHAQSQLADEQTRTATIAAQQAKFVEVRQVQERVDTVIAAQQVGVSTEINWKTYLEGVQAILPGSVSINTVDVNSASPMATYAQATAPLQGARVATVTFTAKSTVLPDVPTWLTALAGLPGYADALPNSVALDEKSGVYTVNITMHVNDAAYSNRFVTEGK